MVYIGTLIGGNITIGSSSPTGHADTWYKYAGDTEWRTVMLGGTIQLFDYGDQTGQIENAGDIVAIEIGTGTQANPVTRIADTAFSGSTSLISVTMPDSITSLGYMIFNGCTSLANVNISNSVTVIPQGMFMRCESLTSISIPSTVTTIEDDAFDNCSGLTSITIPNSVTNIGRSVFYGCSGLTSITFLGKTMQEVQDIEDEYERKCYPWGIEDTTIIHVA